MAGVPLRREVPDPEYEIVAVRSDQALAPLDLIPAPTLQFRAQGGGNLLDPGGTGPIDPAGPVGFAGPVDDSRPVTDRRLPAAGQHAVGVGDLRA